MNFYLFLLLAILAIFWPGHNVWAEVFSWPEATPEEVNIDPRMIADLTAAIERREYGRLKSRDLAKIGQLYLDRGAWQSRRVLAKKWVEESWGSYSNVETDPQVFPEDVSYGYQWWNSRYKRPDEDVMVHTADGFADQYIFVIPQLDMVIVSAADNGNYDGPDMRFAIRDIILDGVEEDFDPVSDGGRWRDARAARHAPVPPPDRWFIRRRR